MKTNLFTALAGGLILATSSMTTFAGLVAHYQFNDTLDDQTGGHNGTIAGTASYDAGKDGDALSIQAADSLVDLANPQTLEFGNDFTISAWVQTSHPGEQVVIYRGDPAHFVAPALQLNVQGAGFFIYGADQGGFGASFTNASVNDGTWHHLAVTYRAVGTNHFTLYLDGMGERPGDAGTFMAGDFVTKTNAPTSVVRLGGRDTDSPDYHFRGLLDEVQIYDRALAADQIQFLFGNPGAVVQPPAIPAILTQPVTNITVALGGNASFSVVAEALTPPRYQWQLNGQDLPGATNSTLTLTNVMPQQAGPYTVKVSTPAGSVTSTPATLVVGGAPELSLNMYAGLTLTGTPGLTYRIDYQNALGQPTDWLAWTNVSLAISPYLLFDIQSTNAPRRYYRAVVVP